MDTVLMQPRGIVLQAGSRQGCTVPGSASCVWCHVTFGSWDGCNGYSYYIISWKDQEEGEEEEGGEEEDVREE